MLLMPEIFMRRGLWCSSPQKFIRNGTHRGALVRNFWRIAYIVFQFRYGLSDGETTVFLTLFYSIFYHVWFCTPFSCYSDFNWFYDLVAYFACFSRSSFWSFPILGKLKTCLINGIIYHSTWVLSFFLLFPQVTAKLDSSAHCDDWPLHAATRKDPANHDTNSAATSEIWTASFRTTALCF